MSSSNPFLSRNELKCAGSSMIIAHLLIITAIMSVSLDYDVYDVTDEEAVIELHELLSSDIHRVEVEFCAALLWISFPFLLMGLYGVHGLIEPIYRDTGGRMLVYIMEKSYVMTVTIITIIIPALTLSSVSFEWSFHEYTPDDDFIPTGYYIQMYSNTLTLEIIDCAAIADATFMIALFILPRFIVHGAKFKKLKSILDPDLPKCCRNWACFMRMFNVVTLAFAISLFVIFCIVLFEFGESGFFSPTGYAKFLVIWSVFVKILIGIRLIHFGCSKQYDVLLQVFARNKILSDAGMDEDNFEMQTIDPQMSIDDDQNESVH